MITALVPKIDYFLRPKKIYNNMIIKNYFFCAHKNKKNESNHYKFLGMNNQPIPKKYHF